MSLTNEHKERLVNMFLRGESVTDLSAFYAVQRQSVEDVLREAIVQLSKLAALSPTDRPHLHDVDRTDTCWCGAKPGEPHPVGGKDTHDPAKEQQV